MTGRGAAITTTGLRKVFPKNRPPENWMDTVPQLVRGFTRRQERKVALDGVDLKIEDGELFGLIGANGAGKTTLIKILACLMRPDGGTATVAGYDIHAQRAMAKASSNVLKGGGWTGVLWMRTVSQNLWFQGEMSGLDPALIKRRSAEVLELLDLTDKADEVPWYLSAGQRHKLTVALLFMVRTPVVLMDEPTVHLDPNVAQTVRRFVKETVNGNRGQTVLMSTHYLQEAELMCDRVAIIDQGRLLACDSPSRLKRSAFDGSIVEIRADRCTEAGLEGLKAIPGVTQVRASLQDAAMGRQSIRIYGGNGLNPMAGALDALGAAGAEVKWAKSAEPSLEEVYLKLVGREIN
ncbi:MAG: ABC transporter ATP-binding protein [Bacillota bacterium]